MTPESIVGGILMVAVAVMGLVVNGYRARLIALEAEIKDIREKYVRRDDLNGHLRSINESTSEIKEQIKELTRLVLASISEKRQ